MPLVVVPTPIGNMEDITLRALDVLRRADLIACEDTRHTLGLLRHYDIRAKLISYHNFNERERTEQLLDRVRDGQTVAVVSDAGTPGMSDPGYIVLKAAIDAGLPVDVLPGATALVPAVLLSGLIPQPFAFVGFLPDTRGERRRKLEELSSCPWTLVFYVSPHKVERHLADILEVFGDREASLVREVSKIHQEAMRSTLSALLSRSREGVRGELVLVISGAVEEVVSDDTWQSDLLRLRKEGRSFREAVSEISDKFGVPKNSAKKWLLERERDK